MHYLFFALVLVYSLLTTQAKAVEIKPGLTKTEFINLARLNNCVSCHDFEKKVIGPSFKDIYRKYKTKRDLIAKELVHKVIKGGVGRWGLIPMPANRKINAEQANLLVDWILYKQNF